MNALPYVAQHGKNIDGNQSGGGNEDDKIHPHLLVPQRGPPVAQKKIIDGEIHAKQRHKHRNRGLNVMAIAGKTVVFHAKAPGSRRAESGTQAVEQRHSPRKKKTDAQHRQRNINTI